MNAIQPSRPHLEPVKTRRVAHHRNRRPRHQQTGAIALETTVKLAINVALSGVAVVSLLQLLPYHKSIQSKLQAIRTEVKETEQRVNRLQTDYKRASNPQEAKNIMREQTHMVDPTRREVVLLESNNKGSDEATALTSNP